MKGVVKDSVVTTFLQLARTLGGLAMLPALISALGLDNYGLVALGVSICTYASLAESILTPALRNRLNAAVATANDPVELQSLHRVAATSAAFMVVLAFVLSAIPVVACLASANVSRAAGIAVVCILSIATGAAGSISDCLHSSQDRLWRIRLYELTALLIGFLLSYVTRGLQIPALTLTGLCLMPQLGRVLAWRQLRRPVHAGRIFDRSETRAFFRRHAHDSISFVALQLMQCALATFPVIFVSWRMSLADTTIYTLVSRVVSAPSSFFIALMPIAWPRITQIFNRGLTAPLRRVMSIGSIAIGGLLGAWCVLVVLFDRPLFNLLTKGAAPTPPPLLVAALAGFVVSSTLVAWIGTTLNALGSFASQLRPTGLSLFILVILAPILQGMIGMPGLALASFAANASCLLLPTYLHARGLLAK